MDPGELAPVVGLDAGLLAQLAPRAVERALAGGHAALGDLPRVGVERVAMLADEQHAVVVVEGEDAGRQVREMDHAVDPGAAVGPGHLVVPDRDPRRSRRRPGASGGSTGRSTIGVSSSIAASSHGAGGPRPAASRGP